MTEIHPALATKIHKHFDALSLYFSATTQTEKDRANYAFRESNRALADWLMQSVGFVLFPIHESVEGSTHERFYAEGWEKHRKALEMELSRGINEFINNNVGAAENTPR